jgi:hypothetical protein
MPKRPSGVVGKALSVLRGTEGSNPRSLRQRVRRRVLDDVRRQTGMNASPVRTPVRTELVARDE